MDEGAAGTATVSLFVQKYGGTSVGSIDRIHAVADRICEHYRAGHQLVVVVSAMGGETNRLSDLASQVSPRPCEREMDVLLSAGEQVSIALLAMAIRERGVTAKSYLADQIPFRTDVNHTRARITAVETDALRAELEKGAIPVVAGFQGQDELGDITTIGRGGSDTTAVALATALNADECQIYTDVEGVFTANPEVVKNARRLANISLEEMIEMASLGSRVLHTRAVEIAHKYGVPLRVLPSFEDTPGTVISKERQGMEEPMVSAVAYEADAAKLTVRGVPDEPGIAYRLLGPIGEASILVDMIVQNIGLAGTTDLTFTVKRGDFVRAMEIMDRTVLKLRQDWDEDRSQHLSITGDDHIAKVTVVGLGIRSHSGVATRMFEALASEGINIQMISTSEIKISVVISDIYVELAVRALHEAFGLGES